MKSNSIANTLLLAAALTCIQISSAQELQPGEVVKDVLPNVTEADVQRILEKLGPMLDETIGRKTEEAVAAAEEAEAAAHEEAGTEITVGYTVKQGARGHYDLP